MLLSLNCFLEEKKSIFDLFLYHILISKCLKTIRLNPTFYFIIKILNKRDFQQIASNYWCEIDVKGFTNLYKEYTKELFSF